MPTSNLRLPFYLILISGFISLAAIPFSGGTRSQQVAPTLHLKQQIRGDIRPKSINHSGNGRFFAQNMMYRHTITVYDRNYRLIKTISDKVDMAAYPGTGYSREANGSPVEIAFSRDGSRAWVSNFKMVGEEFRNPGQDNCVQSPNYDPGFVYEIDTRTLDIENVIRVGCVPKYLTVTPNDQYAIVSNWCSGDLSIIDLKKGEEIRRLPIGAYPRGIVVDSDSRTAYVALMGEDRIGIVDLTDFTLDWIEEVGQTPRHLCIGPANRYLYVTLSRPGQVSKIDLVRKETIRSNQIGQEVRSMAMSRDHKYLYVVDYDQDRLLKVETETLALKEYVSTGDKPIGVTVDHPTGEVWVANYTGSIQVFADEEYPAQISAVSSLAMTSSSGSRLYRPGERFIPQDPTRFIYGAPTGNMDVFSEGLFPAAPTASSSISEPAVAALAPSSVPSTGYQRLRSASGVRFHIIVGSFENEQKATSYAERLRASGHTPILLPDGNRVRISLGEFNTKAEAESKLTDIQQDVEEDAWILSK